LLTSQRRDPGSSLPKENLSSETNYENIFCDSILSAGRLCCLRDPTNDIANSIELFLPKPISNRDNQRGCFRQCAL
jgi:hypothetical protein